MNDRRVWLTSLGLLLALSACGRRETPSGVSREPLARATAAPPAPAAPAPVTVPAKAEKAAPVEREVKKPTKPASAPSESREAPSGEGLTLKRLAITRGIENREPAAAEHLSRSDEPLIAFLELENRSETPEGVVITFEQDGKSVGHIKLEVPAKSSRWRTWGKTRQVKKAGEWLAIVRTKDGKELSRKSFTIE